MAGKIRKNANQRKTIKRKGEMGIKIHERLGEKTDQREGKRKE